MENEKSLFDLSIDINSKAHLKEAAKWARFLAVACLIVFSLGVLLMIVSLLVSLQQEDYPNNAYTTGYVIGVVLSTVAVAAVYVYPCISLLRFARKMITALNTNEVTALNESFRSLKVTLRYLGVLSIFFMAFLLIGILAAINL